MAGCCGEGSGAATGELEAAGHTCGGNGLRQMVVLRLLVSDVARCVEFQRRREELEELGPELLWVGKRVHFGEIIQMAA